VSTSETCEFAIHLLDDLLNGKCEALGSRCGADNEGGAAFYAGIDREIHHRLWWLGQLVSGIAHDTDDLVAPDLVTPRPKPIRCLPIGSSLGKNCRRIQRR